MAENKPKRTRKSHPKTRSGCLTCKIRRKKCGEEKPACLRCTNTGRKCDGYPNINKTGLSTPPTSPEEAVDNWADLEQVDGGSNAATKILIEKRSDIEYLEMDTLQYEFPEEGVFDQFDVSSPSTIFTDRHHNHAPSTPCSLSELEYHTPLAMQPSISRFASEKDFFCFDFFCRQTNPLFTHYFETTMWTGPMMQSCFHPAVHQAMIALGAVHRRYELGITPEAFEYCAYSMKAYSKAMVATQEVLEAGGPESVELIIILSWLMSTFEVFQGNDETAKKHVTGGLQAFFAQKFKIQESKTIRRSATLNERNLHLLFQKLEKKSEDIFGGPARILSRPEYDAGPPDCPEHFYTLDHARDALFTQIHWNFYALEHEEKDSTTRLASQSDRITKLIQWSASYASLCKSLTTQIMPCQGQRAASFCLLRVCREMTYLLLLLQPAAKGVREVETFCVLRVDSLDDEATRVETMNNHFAKLLIYADRLFDCDSNVFERSLKRPSFSIDSGVNPPLYLTPTRCRSAKIRHQVASLMHDTPQEAELRSTLGAWNIAERTSMVEEEAALTCGALPLEIAGVAKWVDVTVFLEERKALRSYCVPETGTGVDGLLWVQEWVTF